ncbi:2-aminoethanethiol dioxygenase [Musa troglodytarum]|uniref:cysteine dioxygenase n=1 Tax=Musa troglodytarum TaxID=320322 RepID=A0A9E7H983_9LILI|nr:2-aminoethanethiol dioxygenase [Musa troglodytarum]
MDKSYEEFYPSFEWVRGDAADTLRVRLPGFERHQINVQADKAGGLRITGERPLGGRRWFILSQDFAVPEDCSVEGMQVKFEEETLWVTLPKLRAKKGKESLLNMAVAVLVLLGLALLTFCPESVKLVPWAVSRRAFGAWMKVEASDGEEEKRSGTKRNGERLVRGRRCRRRNRWRVTAIQRLFLACKSVFKGPGTVPESADVEMLHFLLDKMRPEDVGLSTDLLFFKSKSSSRGTPRITFATICKCDNFSMCIFFLPPKAVIPLHDHPGMTVFSKLLVGSMHIKSYDWLDPVTSSFSTPSAKLRLAKLVLDSEFTAPCNTSILYPTAGGNIHTFTAITPCAVLDVLGPPYSKEDDHDITYYQDHPYRKYSDGDTDQGGVEDHCHGWLEEIDVSRYLKMDGVAYLGPQLKNVVEDTVGSSSAVVRWGALRQQHTVALRLMKNLLVRPEQKSIQADKFLLPKMAVGSYSSCLLILSMILILTPCAYQLQPAEVLSLLRINRLLNYPAVLSRWNVDTDFCSYEANPYVTIICYEESITQLHITGNKSAPPLPRSFSMTLLFATLYRLPNLKVLSLTSLGLWGPLTGKISRLSSLEIVNMSTNYLYGAIPKQVSRLTNLQTLILDHNMFSGRVPDLLGELPCLSVLSLKNNSLSGPLPDSFSSLKPLRVLVLSSNSLSGELPDLSSLSNLQVLDLENNYFGPRFPSLGRKVVTLVLRKNRFSGGLPAEVNSYYLLEHLDISFNRYTGPFPASLLSLPSIHYLSISGNRFTGMLLQSMSCNGELEYVDLSSNLLTGNLPTCLISDSKNKVALYSANCFVTKDHSQHPLSFCQNQALAVGIIPHKENKVSGAKATLMIGIMGGIFGSIFLGMIIFFSLKKATMKPALNKSQRSLAEHASVGYSSQLLPDASYILQTMKLGELGVPPYRSFSLEELEAATNNFDTSSFMGEGSHGQMYRGKLQDGSLVAIRCLKLKKAPNSQNFRRHIELISKLRHHHLVSALGHGFEYYLDDSSVSRLFIVFEFVSNGTLRSNISEGVPGETLTWTHRISAAIGVVKGIQFLHGGMVPGLFANDLKITNVLLDEHLVAKISSYNLPILAEDMKCEMMVGSSSSGLREPNERTKYMDKIDIHDLGVILLEIITGRPIICNSEVVNIMKNQLQESIAADGIARMSFVDPVIINACCDESLKTVMEICLRCLSKEPTQRPSIEDVLWNLQFAAQVQESWGRYSHSSEESPLSPSLPPQSPIALSC